MLVLVIDTATPAVTAGICDITASDTIDTGDVGVVRAGVTATGHPTVPVQVKVLAVRVEVDARRHGEALAPLIAAALTAAGAVPADLAAVVAGVGPGPYTGLRVGLVTAQAFAAALGIQAYPVGTLDALAAAAQQQDQAQRPGPVRPVLVATDARRREVYWAWYDADGRRRHGPAVDRPAAVRDRLDPVPGLDGAPVFAAGAGAVLYADQLGLPVEGPEYPTVAALAELAAAPILAGVPGEPLVPLYLRRPDAQLPGARKPALGAPAAPR